MGSWTKLQSRKPVVHGSEFVRHPEKSWQCMESTAEDIKPSIMLHFVFVSTLDFDCFLSWNRMRTHLRNSNLAMDIALSGATLVYQRTNHRWKFHLQQPFECELHKNTLFPWRTRKRKIGHPFFLLLAGNSILISLQMLRTRSGSSSYSSVHILLRPNPSLN